MDAATAIKRLAGTTKPADADTLRERAKLLLDGIGDLVKQYVYGTLHPRAGNNQAAPGSFAASIAVQVTADTLAVALPDYADSIDQGRKPGGRKVPIGALLQWLKKRGIRPGRNQTLNDVAFAVQNSIYEHGIKARPFLTGTEEYLDQLVEALIEEVLLPELAGLLDEKFSD
jgi:hypothetical protein